MENDNNTNSRVPYIYTFDSMFWITVMGAFFGFLGLLTRSLVKSNCSKVKCLGMECERVIVDDENEPKPSTPNEFSLQL